MRPGKRRGKGPSADAPVHAGKPGRKGPGGESRREVDAWTPSGGWGAVEEALLSAWREAQPSGGGKARAGSPSDAEYHGLSRALLSLQRGLTGDRALVGENYMDEAETFAAYLLYYWPASYAQATRALISSFAGPFAERPDGLLASVTASEGGIQCRRLLAGKRVLDLGSGPGPAGAAALALGAASLLCLEPSARAREAARRAIGRLAPGADFDARPWSLGQALPADGAFDVIIVSHMINEVGREEGGSGARMAFLDSLRGQLSPDGVLVVVEPALLSTSRDLIALRDSLTGDGSAWECLAPCIFKGPCPALAAGSAQTCHDAFPWKAPRFVDELARRAGLDRGELKLSWFAFGPRRSGTTGRDAAEVDGPARPYRVVSDPMLNKAGKTRYFLCGEGGRKSLGARLAELPPGFKDFAALRRGDFVLVSGIGDDGGGNAGAGDDDADHAGRSWSMDGNGGLRLLKGWW